MACTHTKLYTTKEDRRCSSAEMIYNIKDASSTRVAASTDEKREPFLYGFVFFGAVIVFMVIIIIVEVMLIIYRTQPSHTCSLLEH